MMPSNIVINPKGMSAEQLAEAERMAREELLAPGRVPGDVPRAVARSLREGGEIAGAERKATIERVEQELGGELEQDVLPGGQKRLSEGMPGSPGDQFLARFDMTRSFPRIAPTAKKLVDKFPGETFRPVEFAAGQHEIAWLDKSSNKWKLIDSPEKSTWLDALADIPGHLLQEPVGASVLMSWASRLAPVPIRMGAQAIGVGLGTALKLNIEEAWGYTEPTQSFIGESIAAGSFAGAAEGLLAPFITAGKAATGRGVLRMERFPEKSAALRTVTQSRQDAIAVLEEANSNLVRLRAEKPNRVTRPQGQIAAETEFWLNIRNLALAGKQGGHITPGQLHPTLAKLENIAVTVSATAKEVRAKQGAARLSALKLYEHEFGDLTKVDDATLTSIVNELGENYMRGLRELTSKDTRIPFTETSLHEMQAALDSGTRSVVRGMNEMRKRFYNDALESGETATFNLTSAPNAETALQFGVPSDVAKMNVVEYAAFLERGTALRLKSAPVEIPGTPPSKSSLFDEFGQPIVKPGTPARIELSGEGRKQIDKLEGRLKEIVDTLLDPRLAHEITTFEGKTAVQQLQKLRGDLWEVKTALVEGQETDVNRKAGYMWSKLTDVLDNPTSASPKFNELWSKATGFNRTYHEVVEIGSLVKVLKASESGPSALVFMRPGMEQAVTILKQFATPDEWAGFVNGYRTILSDNPSRIPAEFAKFDVDKRALAAVIPKDEQLIWRQIAVGTGKLITPLRESLQQVKTIDDVAGKWIVEKDAGALRALVSASGGPESQFALGLASAVIKHIRSDAQVLKAGRKQAKSSAVADAIDKYDEAGVFAAVMSPANKRRLIDEGFLSTYLDLGTDFGGSLAGTEQAKKAFSFMKLLAGIGKITSRTLSGGEDLWNNYLLGKYVMSGEASRFWLGTGRMPGKLEEAAYIALRSSPQLIANFEQDAKEASGIAAVGAVSAVLDAAGSIVSRGKRAFDTFLPEEGQ